MVISTSNPLDLVARIQGYNDYTVVVTQDDPEPDNIQCHMLTSETLAHDVINGYNARHIELGTFRYMSTPLTIHSYWCEDRKRHVAVEYVCYSVYEGEVIPLADHMTLSLFIASLAMETPHFKDHNVTSNADATYFKAVWNEAERLHDGEVDRMRITIGDGQWEIFKCVAEDENGPKVVQKRCYLTTP